MKPLWDKLKTEAIDFSRPFVWIDDDPLQVELNILRSFSLSGKK